MNRFLTIFTVSALAFLCASCSVNPSSGNLLAPYDMEIGEAYDSPIRYFDGTVPFYRDAEGTLWGMCCGDMKMYRGTSMEDMVEAWPCTLNFRRGNADTAFAGIPYPEGVKARGSVWPFGLYICPGTGRFFCFFHNETGWAGEGTAYDAFGPCETPKYDSDFRHIGLMHSDDQGKTWDFDRWVVTAETVCFTSEYNPGAGVMVGQPAGLISLGSGDFTTYVDDEYIYLIYDIIKLDMATGRFCECDAYMARTRRRDDGVMGDFVKYYGGKFCEPGNFGRETPVVRGAWHARMAWSDKLDCYILCSSPIRPEPWNGISNYMELRTSKDMFNWSEPVSYKHEGHETEYFGNHYQAIVSYHGKGNPWVIEGDDFTVLDGHNGTGVTAHDFHMKLKDARQQK